MRLLRLPGSIRALLKSLLCRQAPVLALAIVLLSQGCGRPLVHEHSIPANISIEVKDPLCRRLTDATEKFEVVAVGEFKAGSFVVQGVPLQVAKGTAFRLELTLPIDDPQHIDTALASGHLWTSAPLVVGGVSISQDIGLSNGKATAEVDLVRAIGIFLFNVLQNQLVDSSGGSGIKDVVETIRLKHAVLSLRPGASFDIGKIHLVAAPHSKVELNNVALDRALNYDGELLFDMQFSSGCNYIGEKVDIYFNGGSALFALHARRIQRVLTLFSENEQRLLKLEDCTYRFGKQKQSSVRAKLAALQFSQFTWQKREEEEKARIHALADMVLNSTFLELKNSRLDLVAVFSRPVPATLRIDRDGDARQILFSTDKSAIANSLDINLTRKSTNTSIALVDAKIGPISLTKSGDLKFSLDEGTAALRQIVWHRGEKEFKLVTVPGSTLSITEGLSMELSRDESGTHCSLPLSVDLGTATLSGSFGTLELGALNGDLQINADGDVGIEGNLSFSIVQSDLLGNHKMEVRVRGIRVASKEGVATVHFNECSVIMPNHALFAEISRTLPSEKVYSMAKPVLKDQRWRYRNAVVTKIVLRKPTIEKLWSVKNNEEHFSGYGDIEALGTVEKGSMLSIFKKTDNWQNCPWSARARLAGSGVLAYQFEPNGTLSDSQFKYTLKMNLPLPEDLKLDWSKVSGGLLQKAEKSIIVGAVKNAPPISLDYQGKFKLFPGRKSQLKSLRIKQFRTEPAGDGIEINFVADANL
jgi:hypothetical protein